MNELLGYIIGKGSVWLFIACLLFMYFTAAVRIALDVKQGVKNSPNTPNNFNSRFFLSDNLIRIIGVIGMGFLLVRFVRPWVFPITIGLDNSIIENKTELQLLSSVVIGLFLDMVANWIRKLRWFANKTVREKFKQRGLTDDELDKTDQQ